MKVVMGCGVGGGEDERFAFAIVAEGGGDDVIVEYNHH